MALVVKATNDRAAMIDEAEVRRALIALVDPASFVELRGGQGWRSYVYRGDRADELCEAALSLSDGKGVYFTLNPLKAFAGHRAATKDDVLSYRWLLVDVDTQRPKDHNATDDEKKLARVVLDRVTDTTASFGWPEPVLIDSGNGWHALYRVDLPPDAASQALLKGAIAALGERCDDGAAKIDRSVHNHARVSKLPGTWARKGPHSTERPHRLAQLVHVPNKLACVTAEQLTAIAAPRSPHQTNGRHYAPGGSAYGRGALERELGRLLTASLGDRNNQLNRSAFALAQLVAGGELPGDLVELELLRTARAIGLDEREVLATYRSGATAGGKSPRQAPEKDPPRVGEQEQPRRGAPEPRGWVMEDLLAAELPEPRWLIPGLLSEGLNVLVGKPKQGKSFLALNLALTVAAGGMALGNVKVQPARVLYLSLEDKDRRVQSRVRKIITGLKVDLGRRLEVFTVWPRVSEGGLDRIGEWVGGHGDEGGLVVIDVLKKFKAPARGKGNAYDEDYEALSPIKELADKRGVDVLVIHHVKKGKSEDWIEDISGSLGIGGTADGAMMLVRNRGEDEAVLKVTGRDVDEKEIAVRFERETCVWKSLGDAEKHTENKLEQAILACLRQQPAALFWPREIADLTKQDRSKVATQLSRMAQGGRVYRQNSRYGWPPPPPDGAEGEGF